MLSWWTRRKLSLQLQCRIGRKKIQCIGNWSSWRASWCVSRWRGGSNLSAQWHTEIAAPSPLGTDGCDQGLGLPNRSKYLPANGPAGAHTAESRTVPPVNSCSMCVSVVQPERCGEVGLFGAVAEVAVKAFFPYVFSEFGAFWVTQPSCMLWFSLVCAIHVCSSAAAFCREHPCTQVLSEEKVRRGSPLLHCSV